MIHLVSNGSRSLRTFDQPVTAQPTPNSEEMKSRYQRHDWADLILQHTMACPRIPFFTDGAGGEIAVHSDLQLVVEQELGEHTFTKVSARIFYKHYFRVERNQHPACI